MLNIEKVQSVNEVVVTGVLKELDVEERETSDGRKYITSIARIGVDQEINGVMTENVIPVRSFTMRKKADGTDNKAYDNILNMKENFVSEAAATDGIEPTRVAFRGKTCNLTESIYVNRQGTLVDNVFEIDCNFPNVARSTDADEATFTVSGVVGEIKPEYKDDAETGRIKVKLIIIGYRGKANVLEFVAESGNAASFIETNWHQGDTVSLTGSINMTYKVIEKKIEQAFGAPKVEHSIVSKNELIITGGSFPLDEDNSYDGGQVKIALGERQARIKETEERAKSKSKPAPAKKTSVNDFGF